MTVLNKISMHDIIDDTRFKEKNLKTFSLFFPLISFPLLLQVCCKIYMARFSLYVPFYLLLETDPRSNNFWALQMYMVDVVPHVIFSVFYILTVRSVLQPSGLVLGVWGPFWYWSFSCLPELQGKWEGRWKIQGAQVDSCALCVWWNLEVHESCRVSSLWDVHFFLKNMVYSRRNSNTRGSGLLGGMEKCGKTE